jgi:uncharacterized iron-regulated membrane protein
MPKSRRSRRKHSDELGQQSPKTGRPGRWLRRILLFALLAVAVMGGMLWWQERALSQATQALEEGETEYAMYMREHP